MEILEPDNYYHIYNHTNGAENLFRNEDNYFYFLKKYNQYISPIAETFAYCLMPNHFHFLTRIKEEKEIIESFPKFQKNANKSLQGFQNLGGAISKQFSNFFNSYSKAFNKKFDRRRGSLFNQNFKRKRIISEQYLKQAIVYIHLNPVQHEFVEKPSKWKYSSYNAFISTKSTLIKKHEVIELFDGENNFRDFHNMKATEIYSSKMEMFY